jgi:hypothetical protein
MTNKPTAETKSYRDLAGERIAASAAAREAREARFPKVAEVYDAFYLTFEPLPAHKELLRGPQGIIGSPYTLTRIKDTDENGPTPGLYLTTIEGIHLAELRGDGGQSLSKHLDDGWEVSLALSAVWYRNVDKTFFGEVACICYDPVCGLPLQNFTKNVMFRVARGNHPGLGLSQDRFIRVIQSNGSWYLTKEEELPAQEKGTVVFKKRRTWTEGVTTYALAHKKGCNALAVLFWIILAAAILLLVILFIL